MIQGAGRAVPTARWRLSSTVSAPRRRRTVAIDADSLAEVLPDPALFEPERVNKGFGGSYLVLRRAASTCA